MAESTFKINWDKESKWYKRILRFLVVSSILTIIGLVFLFFVLARSNMPSFSDLENPEYELASVVYDIHGRSFGKYFIENRETVDFGDLSPKLVDALISTEDTRFYSHSGIDFFAIVRVVFKTILLQDQSSGGGSTITQQLAKLLYKRPPFNRKSSLSRAISILNVKLKEWIIAVKLEKSYTKDEIMAMYLNKFEFINGAHGIQAAAQIYFGKDQKDLNIEEAATLVGMLQNPARFNPKRFPERTTERRNVVLNKLRSAGDIDRELCDSLKDVAIDMSNFKKLNLSDGPAPYFRAELTKWLKKILKEDVNSKPDGTPYNIYTDGIKVHTTIDLDYQKYAEQAAFEQMKENQKTYWHVWRGMNPFVFETDTPEEVEQRKASVNRRIYYSDRYRDLFKAHFTDINKIVSKNNSGFEVTEPALRHIINTEEDPQAVIAGFKRKDLREKYYSLIKEDIWNEVTAKWAVFQKDYKKVFNTKIPMKVFAYNEQKWEEKEMSPKDSVIYHLRFLQVGMLAVDPQSGYIKAWVGGIDHNYFKFDHILNRRQVGSTIKPFVYATAIGLQGISPCQKFQDIQYTIAPGDANLNVDKEWSPANANGLFTGNMYNLYQGLLYSKNSITVRLIKEMGSVEVIRELLDNVGISKTAELPGGRLLIPRLPSISLGSVDLSVMEMSGAYTSFANDGVYTKPLFVTRIEDKNGKTIYQARGFTKAALNPAANAVMVDMLQNNTGGRFGMGIKSENGGKTGTTNDYADTWFMGVTPTMVVGTWVGGDEKWVRFFNLSEGQGFKLARPIFQKFIKSLEEDSTVHYNSKATFTKPPPEFYEMINCEKFKSDNPEEEQLLLQENDNLTDEFEDEDSEEESMESLQEDEFEEDEG